jgi:hypothetical protein
MPMSSPSNSGKNTLLSRIGTVKKVWSSEEEGEFDPKRGCVADTGIERLVFFFLLFLFFPLFLPILFVILVLRDAYQTTTGIHPDFRA